MRRFFIFLLIGLCILSWTYFLKEEDRREEEFLTCMQKAEAFEKMDLPAEACHYYEKALNIREDERIYPSLVDLYLEYDLDRAIALVPKLDQEQTDRIFKKILELEDFDSYNKALDMVDENWETYYAMVYGKLKISDKTFEDVIFDPQSPYHIVKKRGKWGLVDRRQRYLLGPKYDYIFAYSDPYISLVEDGNYLIVDLEVKPKGRIEARQARIFPMLEGYYLVDRQGYSYYNRLEKVSPSYERATSFSQARALVKKDQWILIDKDFNRLASYDFREIKTDALNRGIFNGRIIIKDGGTYLYDLEKEVLSDRYEDVDFDYGDLIAVKKGKWGFIGQDFKLEIDFAYDGAKSFNRGLGAVKNGHSWTVISKYGLEDYEFEDMTGFSDYGVGFVKIDGLWHMASLGRKDYEDK